jgi:hypothetical protein
MFRETHKQDPSAVLFAIQNLPQLGGEFVDY